MTTLQREDVIGAVTELAESRDLKACVSSSLKGGCYAGGGAIIGGMVGGPVGIAVGKLITSVNAAGGF